MRKKDMDAAFKMMGVTVVKGMMFYTIFPDMTDGVWYLKVSEHRTNQAVFDGVVKLLEHIRSN